jgi:rhodanese-related sulfurtransferase
MKTLMAVALLLAVTSCKQESSTANPPEAAAKAAEASEVSEVSVDALASKLDGGGCQAVDANGPGTRKRLGTIPGAVLLSDYEAFSLSELPSDKSRELVFYCANEHCGASHQAAKRALLAGYSNVRVLPAGIAGWVSAGKPTAKL